MEKFSISIVVMAALVGLAACDSAKSPDTVAKDVSSAQAKSASDIADAQQKAAQETGTTQAKSDEQSTDVKNADAKAVYDVGTTKADGDHKVALAKCEALSGDQQKACKDAADAQYNLVKAHAKANLDAAQSH